MCCERGPDSIDCVFAGLFHAALSLAVVLFDGQRLSQALQRSVATMVTSCVQKQLQDSVSVRPDLPESGVIFGQELAGTGKLYFASCGLCLKDVMLHWDGITYCEVSCRVGFDASRHL